MTLNTNLLNNITGNCHTKSTMNIIGFSSTKGGSGKSTSACSIGAALSIKGYRVLIIDMDGPQYTTYRFFDNREKCITNDTMIVRAIYFDIGTLGHYSAYDDYKIKFIHLLEKEGVDNYDFVILDSGGYYNNLTKLVIEFANILITPMNLSAIDFNVLFNYDAINDDISEGQYAKFVRESKHPNRRLKWYVIPNRCHQIFTEYQKNCLTILKGVGDLFGYKVTSSIMDRNIYSQGFDLGLTCFDSIYHKQFFQQSYNELLILNARREINKITDEILETVII